MTSQPSLTSITPTAPTAPTPKTIFRAGQELAAGNLVAFPTETVYGLGADATNDKAVASLFHTKQRPAFNPLIVHVKDQEKAAEFVDLNDLARTVMSLFCPGALTVVLKKRANSNLSLLVTAGLDTVAIRIPAHPIAQDLLKAFGGAIAAPSANISGTTSPTQAAHVQDQFQNSLTISMLIDGGPCSVGIESTIIDLSGNTPTLLRPGGVSREDIESRIGPLALYRGDKIKAPGQIKSHYAPSIPVRINVHADQRRPGENLLTFGPNMPTDKALNLSETGDINEAAANLFAMLRTLDQDGVCGIAVTPIPNTGLGLAINDRLNRASAPKPDHKGPDRD